MVAQNTWIALLSSELKPRSFEFAMKNLVFLSSAKEEPSAWDWQLKMFLAKYLPILLCIRFIAVEQIVKYYRCDSQFMENHFRNDYCLARSWTFLIPAVNPLQRTLMFVLQIYKSLVSFTKSEKSQTQRYIRLLIKIQFGMHIFSVFI